MVQLHSAYLHSMGVRPAVRLVELTLNHAVMVGAVVPTVSRIDLYADVQGWSLAVEDMGRFVSRSRARGGGPLANDDGQERFWMLGRGLTGFDFGKRGGAVYVRIYDKTTEIRRRGPSWLPDLWGKRETDEPVWRIEFELRRPVLTEHGLRTVDDVLDGQQDLWRYVSSRWLTYRTPSPDGRVRRWPVDPIWEEVQAIRLRPTELGVVRGRVADASEQQLIVGTAGYLSSWAAMHPEWHGLGGGALEHVRPILSRYLESSGRTWEAELVRKRARRMDVTGWVDDPAEDAGDAA